MLELDFNKLTDDFANCKARRAQMLGSLGYVIAYFVKFLFHYIIIFIN